MTKVGIKIVRKGIPMWRRVSVIISVRHTDTRFYYQCGLLKVIQQMAPHYCPKY